MKTLFNPINHKAGEKHLGRVIKEAQFFNVPGDFESLYAARRWLSKNDYTSGSTGRGNDPVAIRKGKYDLPQKWHNISDDGRKSVDGVMYCEREGPAVIYIFE